MPELCQWPEIITQLSEEAESAISSLEELRTFWEKFDGEKSLLFKDLIERVHALDMTLNEWTVRNHDGLKGEYWSLEDWHHGNVYLETEPGVTRSEYECCNCGAHYCPFNAKKTKRETLYFFESSHRQHYVFPCCTRECEVAIARKAKFHFERRKQEWEVIQQCKRLIKEARHLLKNHQGVSQ